jgi:hypothetical protein
MKYKMIVGIQDETFYEGTGLMTCQQRTPVTKLSGGTQPKTSCASH